MSHCISKLIKKLYIFQEFFTDSLTSEVGLNFDLQETIRVLNEKLELKNRKLEDLQEKLDKFEDLKIKVRLHNILS